MRLNWGVVALIVVTTSACSAKSPAAATPVHRTLPGESPDPAATVVEYVKPAGQGCLQPKVTAGSPTDADLVDAQHRWLAQHYPGYRLLRQSHVLTLAPEFRPEGSNPDNRATESDSIEFQTSDGKPISECFSLALPPTGVSK